MCGRYSLTKGIDEISAGLGVLPLELRARYNIAPIQEAPVALHDPERKITCLRWGLVPAWSKDESIACKTINARAESVATTASFREAFKRRRCLIFADGFYEWRKQGRVKMPVRFTLKTEEVFAFAGLWETWRKPDGTDLCTFTIITTEANELTKPVHDRMPVILAPESYPQWLDPTPAPAERLQALLRPFPAEAMRAYAVDPMVNSVANDDPQCLLPFQAAQGELSF